MPEVIRKLRSDFARRLIDAMSFAGLDDSPTTLSRFFNLHGDGDVISMHGARRWLLGEAIPTQKHLNSLARMLGVSSAWLLLGKGAMLEGVGNPSQPDTQDGEQAILQAYLTLNEPERELVWNLMRMLTRSPRRVP